MIKTHKSEVQPGPEEILSVLQKSFATHLYYKGALTGRNIRTHKRKSILQHI